MEGRLTDCLRFVDLVSHHLVKSGGAFDAVATFGFFWYNLDAVAPGGSSKSNIAILPHSLSCAAFFIIIRFTGNANSKSLKKAERVTAIIGHVGMGNTKKIRTKCKQERVKYLYSLTKIGARINMSNI